LYITRTSNPEENEWLVHETLSTQADKWELACVLPDIANDLEYDWEIGRDFFFFTFFLYKK
jgi:hypothetical protein